MLLEANRDMAGVRTGVDLEIVRDAVAGQHIVQLAGIHLQVVLVAHVDGDRAVLSQVLNVLIDEGQRGAVDGVPLKVAFERLAMDRDALHGSGRAPGTTSGTVVLTWLKPILDASTTMDVIAAARSALIECVERPLAEAAAIAEPLACMMCGESTGQGAVGSSILGVRIGNGVSSGDR